ncbi:PH domain-containing protein [Nocardia sp. NRRL S-836]|uniref:PH domain-containing protein n=1 Tax=Nocardia sp. NRRL S-836 TaxID=1519492 RepID=UPI0006AF3AF6|nr:PH domain-containing protein [Nocardia sp. NRRL S-836]KOV80309.1 membrane protein [Nocardia sp. NRRL S-836]
MAYPDDLLSSGEHVVIHRHPHWKTLVFPVFWLLVVVVLGAYLAGLVGDLSWAGVARTVLAVACVVLVVWLTVVPLVRWRTTHFIVTTDRVMCREGVVKRTGLDIPLTRVIGVRFEQGVVDRMLGCGTLVIESASEEPIPPFDDIPAVEKVHTLLYREVNDNPEDDFHPRTVDGRA